MAVTGRGQRWEEMRREAQERREAVEQDTAELAAREFTGEATDGSVQVTVDGSGSTRRVQVDPKQLSNIRGDELGRRVVEALQLARRAAQEGTAAIQERMPGGDDAIRQLRDTLGYGNQ